MPKTSPETITQAWMDLLDVDEDVSYWKARWFFLSYAERAPGRRILSEVDSRVAWPKSFPAWDAQRAVNGTKGLWKGRPTNPCSGSVR